MFGVPVAETVQFGQMIKISTQRKWGGEGVIQLNKNYYSIL